MEGVQTEDDERDRARTMSGSKARFEYLEDLQKRRDQSESSPARNILEHRCAIDVDLTPLVVRGTGIICTIGPSCKDVEKLKELIMNGMNIARMNFSHGSHEYHKEVIDNVREAAKVEHPHPLAIALDTKGPEIRTGLTKGNQDVTYKQHSIIKVTNDRAFSEAGDENTIYLDYAGLQKSVTVGGKIYIADGMLSLEVMEILNDGIKAKVLNEATIGSRKNCNLPGAIVDLPAVSEKDILDLQFGVREEVDMIFASFIRKASDVRDVRAVLGEKGKRIKIIAKIENHEGIKNVDEILTEADGIMVARGDMGMEIPLEKVFLAQKMMIARCNLANKPVICATQMLESMVYNPRPTRAEVSDVANAVLDGADCVMLSGETAKGAFPAEAVLVMHKICREAEAAAFHRMTFEQMQGMKLFTDPSETTCIAAVSASFKVNAAAIVCMSTSGRTAHLLSHYRPRCPIIVLTRDPLVARQCHLYRGLFPLHYDRERASTWSEDIDARLLYATETGRNMGFISPGSFIVFVSGYMPGAQTTNTMRVLQVAHDGSCIGKQDGIIRFSK